VFCPTSGRCASTRNLPLEAITALHDARTDEDKKFATQRLRPT